MHEQRRNVELKRSISWDDSEVKAKIVKTILGMSNIQDGGYLILGFEEHDGSFEPVGLSEDDLKSYKYDDVCAEVSRYADPYATFLMEVIEDEESGRKFLVLSINEFEEIPVICRRNGLQNLQEGVLYTRSRRLPSTTAVPSQSEMREIIDMAIKKGLRRFIENAQYAGIRIEGVEDEYDKELREIP
jgi:hypothetical protein